KALGDDAHRPKYIETISKRGYRLIAPVGDATLPASPSTTAPHRGVGARRAAILVVAGFGVATVLGFLAAQFPARMPWPLGPDTRGAMSASMPIIAVLPLANLSGDAAREYFSDGVTEDIIAALGRFSGLRVISKSAIQGFKGKAPALDVLR